MDAAISQMNKAAGATKKFLVGNPSQTGVTPAPKLPEGALGKPTVVDMGAPANTPIKATAMPGNTQDPRINSMRDPKIMYADKAGNVQPGVSSTVQQPANLTGAAEKAGQRMGPMDNVTAAERVSKSTVPGKPSIASKVLNYTRNAQVSPEGEGFLKAAGKKALNTVGAVGGGVTAYNAGKDIADNGLKFDSFENSVKSANNLFDIGTGSAMAGGSAAAATGIGAVPGAALSTLGAAGQTGKLAGGIGTSLIDKLPRIFGARDFSQQIAGVDNRKAAPTNEEIAALKAKVEAGMPAASNVVMPTGTPEQMAEKARSDRFYKTGTAQNELSAMIPPSGRNMVESGNNGLRTLATNPDAMAKFNEVQGLRDNGIRGEVDANGRVSLTGYKPAGYQSEGEKARIADNIARGNTLDSNGNFQTADTRAYLADKAKQADVDKRQMYEDMANGRGGIIEQARGNRGIAEMDAKAERDARLRISDDQAKRQDAQTKFAQDHTMRQEERQSRIDQANADTAAKEFAEKARNTGDSDTKNFLERHLPKNFDAQAALLRSLQDDPELQGKTMAELLRTNPKLMEQKAAQFAENENIQSAGADIVPHAGVRSAVVPTGGNVGLLDAMDKGVTLGDWWNNEKAYQGANGEIISKRVLETGKDGIRRSGIRN